MKVSTVLAALLAITWATEISEFEFPNAEARFRSIQEQAEVFYRALPAGLKEDANLLVPDIIKKYGYPSEVHTVVSPSGYVLEMHRIPYGREGPSPNRPAVYLQHGILSSSADWILAGPNRALSYILADNGYDVWISNVRGTRYSRKHKRLDPSRDAKEFWDFTWHEIAVDDVPAMIDYVIEKTNQEKIFYIGHSQGTTVFYVMCSEKPQYNNKFRAMFSLAPIAYMKHMTSPLMRVISLFETAGASILNIIGLYEFLPTSGFVGKLGEVFCSDGSLFQILCTNSLFAVCGFNPSQMNSTLLPVIMAHTPAGSASKQFLHFAQEINSGKFRKYDFGYIRNVIKYGQLRPPSYNLGNVKAPVYLHYSKNDWLSNEKDVFRLYHELGNAKALLLSPDNMFNHLDYLYGINAKEYLYNRIIGLMRRH